ncbi:MAG: hypothetical protein JKY37_26915 [Nannocystaceae bacterium]|nr:hypothetical protein [Nannocystaceae bacterium]
MGSLSMAAIRPRRTLRRSIAAIVFGYATLASATVLAAESTRSAVNESTVATETELAVTSSKAPASRLVLVPVQSPPSPHVALATSADPPEPSDDRIPHRGLVVDANVGVLGCFATSCKQRHAATPGVRVGGFIGGNIRGWVSIGVAGGWGTLSPDPPPGSDVLGLYGLDADALMREFDTPRGQRRSRGSDIAVGERSSTSRRSGWADASCALHPAWAPDRVGRLGRAVQLPVVELRHTRR